MPEYLRPGVYVEETSYRGKPIEGVSTSTAGFVGAARTGPEGTPTFIDSLGRFRRIFGDPISAPADPGDYLGHSVKAFFDNGGKRCFVVRVLGPGALASGTTLNRGTVLRLAPGVTVRGPNAVLRLNTLRGISVGDTLDIFTRPGSSAGFAAALTANVDAINPSANSVTLDVEVPAGVTLEPDHTRIYIQGREPTIGNGAIFSSRHRGNDGDRIRVEIRPRDRSPVALATGGSVRVNPQLALAADGANGVNAISLTAASLDRLRTDDEISIGGADFTVTAIADSVVDFASDTAAAAAQGAANTITLISRGGNNLATPMQLAAGVGGAFNADFSGAGPFNGLAVPHDIAMVLRANDVIEVDDGAGNIARLEVTQRQNAQTDAPGDHVTLSGNLGAAAPVGTEVRWRGDDAAGSAMPRVYVNDVSGLAQPNGNPAEEISIAGPNATATAEVALVDPNTNAVFLIDGAGTYPTADVTALNWVGFETLTVATPGQDVFRVASTASFYSGAKVELDLGGTKEEAVVQSIDSAARTVTLTQGIGIGAAYQVDPDPVLRHAYLRVHEIDVLVYQDDAESGIPVLAESFEGLTWNADQATDAGLRFFAARLNDQEVGSDLVEVTTPVQNLANTFAECPVGVDGFPQSLTGGDNGATITDLQLIGEDNGPGRRTGIQALTERDDISMVAVPGVTQETVQAALITHAERMKYRIAVLDTPLSATDVNEIQSHRNNYDSKYGAYYAPWLRALNSRTGRIESFPPSAYAMGIYARSDNTRGVHKAPANEVVRNITEPALPLTGGEQEILNPAGVNLIRDLTPRGIRLWGARTISSDAEWKYVNVRRLFIYLEHSIDRGTQWVVFEPNSEALWSKVVTTITSFLNGAWKQGMLMGTSPEEAFFVTCDRSTMTQDDIDNGRLIVQIGIAPVKPAEFVIFRIGQFTANAS